MRHKVAKTSEEERRNTLRKMKSVRAVSLDNIVYHRRCIDLRLI